MHSPLNENKNATGFEEYYVEGPTGPQEHNEENDFYNINFTPAERLEAALQRYFRRRKFDNKKRVALDHFVFFGGVENRCRQFTKQDKNDLKNMEKEERDLATAVHFIDKEKQNSSQWALDFLGVAEAYFGSWFPQSFDYTQESLNSVCKVVVNFYNYLLYHNVCAEEEIKRDILSARSLVQNRVQVELLAVKKVGLNLPGAFNQACEILFNQKDFSPSDISNVDQAKAVIERGLIALSSDEMVEFVKDPKWATNVIVDKEVKASLQVVCINRMKPAGTERSKNNGNCLGFMTCKPWKNNNLMASDLPKGQEKAQQLPEFVEIWLEDRLLEDCFIGMGLMANIRLLRFGDTGMLWTIGEDIMPLCSFYRYILNELGSKHMHQVETTTDREIDRPDALKNGEDFDESDSGSEADKSRDWSVMESGRVIDDTSM
jgi:hypothetical protein